MQLITTINQRKVFYLPLNEGWQNQIPEKNWCVFIIANKKNVELANKIASFCVKNEVSYVCVGGSESEWMHDFIDESFVGNGKDVYFAMTTWSKDISEEFWFACYPAMPEEGVIDSIVCIDMDTDNINQIQSLVDAEKNKKPTYEILEGLPQDDSLVIPLGGQPHYSEGFVVRFFKKDGSSWVGNFKSGWGGLNAVYDYPEKEQTVVFAAGEGYVINLNNNKVLDEFGGGYKIIFKDKGRLITYDDTGVTVIEPNGEIWKSKRISWDGLKDVKVENDIMSGLSWSPMNGEGLWEPFSLNLITKEVIGGSYRESTFKTKPHSPKRKLIVVSAIILLIIAGKIYFHFQNQKDAWVATYAMTGIQQLPSWVEKPDMEITGSMFTRGFTVTFSGSKEQIDQWAKNEPALQNIKAEDLGNSVYRYILRPQTGAQYAEVKIDHANNKVTIRTYWS